MEPTAVVVQELIWDDWNVEHISRHELVPTEVELALSDKHAIYLKAKQGRVMVLGRAKKRLITTILNAQEEEGVFYVVTARDMSKKERAYYRALKES